MLKLDEDRRKDNAASQEALEAKYNSSFEPKKSAEEMKKLMTRQRSVNYDSSELQVNYKNTVLLDLIALRV